MLQPDRLFAAHSSPGDEGTQIPCRNIDSATIRTDACASVLHRNRPNASGNACGIQTEASSRHALKGAAAGCCSVWALGRASASGILFVAPFTLEDAHMAGNYIFDCPSCGHHYELRQRVTLNKRRCSNCGHPITPQAIDDQKWNKTKFQILGFLLLIPIGCVINIVNGLKNSNSPDKSEAASSTKTTQQQVANKVVKQHPEEPRDPPPIVQPKKNKPNPEPVMEPSSVPSETIPKTTRRSFRKRPSLSRRRSIRKN